MNKPICCWVRVVRYENYLAGLLCLSDTCRQNTENAVIVEVVFGLVDNERCLLLVQM